MRRNLPPPTLRIQRSWTLLALSGAVSFGLACGASTTRSGFDDADGGDRGDTSEGGSGAGFVDTDGGDGGDDSGSECPLSATLVYLTGEDSKLYSFYPPDQTFNLIGTFDCLSFPTHMTIDRQGHAWVVADGNLYEASTADASCAAVSTWKPNVDFADFSLTFIGVSNAVDNTLYLLDESSKLATFDIASGKLSEKGTVAASPSHGDMTSNGDGTLYFLSDVAAPTLYQWSPTDGSTIASSKVAANGGGSQALAFWGGSFYAFENDTIYQFDPQTKSTKRIGTAPIQVTGAGQSTCVPKTPPPPK